MPKKETKAGAMDDNAVKRVKDAKKKRKNMLQDIFDDNSTGRYSDDKDD